MIPKIIHYCWLSDPPNYPPEVVTCMESWKKYLPDYQIIHWNASNFDVNCNRYVREAYEAGKFAFVSDYVRLWALYHYGGVYLDSDIEVLRSFDPLLDQKGFTGFEDRDRISAWIFGSEKGNPLFQEFLDDYKGRIFKLGEGQYDMTPNPVPITRRLMAHGLRLDGSLQKLDYITVYPMDCFCPFNPYRKSGDCFTERTMCNHYFNGEWKKSQSAEERRYAEKEARFRKIFGNRLGPKLSRNLAMISYGGFFPWLRRRVKEKRKTRGGGVRNITL